MLEDADPAVRGYYGEKGTDFVLIFFIFTDSCLEFI